MAGLRFAFICMLACTGLLLYACSGGSVTYRYRLTVTVDTPEGPRTGSSVIEVTTCCSSRSNAGVTSTQRGEAVAVDLGRRGTLFALLSVRDDPFHAAKIAPAALMPVIDSRGTAEAAINNLRAMRDVRGAVPVPRRVYPVLVNFRDIRDPNTVMEVDPDRLEARFGPGVHLRAITVEMSDDALTSTIPARFPWWTAYREKRFDGATVRIENVQDPNLSHHITRSYFSTED